MTWQAVVAAISVLIEEGILIFSSGGIILGSAGAALEGIASVASSVTSRATARMPGPWTRILDLISAAVRAVAPGSWWGEIDAMLHNITQLIVRFLRDVRMLPYSEVFEIMANGNDRDRDGPPPPVY